MSTIHRAATVAADPETCFDYIADPTLAPLFLSSLYSITPIDIEPRAEGNTWAFEYDLFGVAIKGESECTVYDRPSKYVWKATSGIETQFSYGFEPADGGTTVSVDVDYKLTDDLLGRLADATLVERMNEHEADAALRNLTAILEGA